MKKEKVFQDLLLESQNKHGLELASFIIRAVGLYYKMDDNYHTKRTRARDFVQSRQMAMYMIRKHTDMTMLNVSALFKMDHSTVVHAVKKIKDYCFYDKRIRQDKDDIEYIIKFRAEALKENADWRKNYFFVDLNNIFSLNFEGNKSIILSGYSKLDVLNLKEALRGECELKEHSKTGMYILEKLNKEVE